MKPFCFESAIKTWCLHARTGTSVFCREGDRRSTQEANENKHYMAAALPNTKEPHNYHCVNAVTHSVPCSLVRPHKVFIPHAPPHRDVMTKASSRTFFSENPRSVALAFPLAPQPRAHKCAGCGGGCCRNAVPYPARSNFFPGPTRHNALASCC